MTYLCCVVYVFALTGKEKGKDLLQDCNWFKHKWVTEVGIDVFFFYYSISQKELISKIQVYLNAHTNK